jgi:lysophospholipid hydrolase
MNNLKKYVCFLKNIEKKKYFTIVNSAFQDVLLIYIITGGLSIIQYPHNVPGGATAKKMDNAESHAITMHPGEVVGGLAVLTGESSLYTIRAKYYSRVGLLSKEIVYR